MRLTFKLFFLLAIVVIVLIPANAMAKGLQDDKIITGGTYTLESGETLDGNLIVFGGVVVTAKDSTINGDVVLMGGTLTIDGAVEGNVLVIGGTVTLGENAIVKEDVSVVAGTINQSSEAVVEGKVIHGFQIPYSWITLRKIDLSNIPRNDFPFSTLGKGLWFFFRIFIWAAIAALMAIFLPNPIDRVSRAIVSQPILSGGVGLLTALVAPILLVILAITIILIPISLLGLLILIAAWFFGRVSLGMEVGRRIGNAFHKDWPAPIDAGLGTFALVLVVDGIGSLVPCVGWIVPIVVGILGLGGVILTLFGTRTYPPGIPGPSVSIPSSGERTDTSIPPAIQDKVE
jgi:hypothetical protein